MVRQQIAILMLAVGLAVISSDGFAQEEPSRSRSQARSQVISRNGVVATEHPLASQAGAMILARGGHAVDAAVAANAVMGLVAPMSNGMGGDLFAIIYEAKSGKLYGLNASGWAPAGLTVEFLKNKGYEQMPMRGIHAVTVPGAVDGWDKLLGRFGRLKLADVLAPAIRYAEDGFPVTEWVGGAWAGSEGLLREDENAARTYLPNDHAPHVGTLFRNPDLATSLKLVATKGRDGFYKGDLAERIVKYSKRHGGTMTEADLAEFSARVGGSHSDNL